MVKPSLFVFWFLVTASDAIAAGLTTFALFRIGNRFSRFLAVFLIGVVIEAVVAAVSLAVYWPQEAIVAPTFAEMRIVGRAVKMLCVWILALYLLGFFDRKGEGPHLTKTPDGGE